MNMIFKKNFLKNYRGRFTKGQKNALTKYWFNLGINYKKNFLNFEKIFNNPSPVILEIGFGMGDALITTAINNPKINFIGIEIYLPGIGSCLYKINKFKIKNLKLIYYDALEVLKNMIQDDSLKLIQIFFPDPWYKKKHNKRRIIQLIFIKIIKKKLSKNGILHIVTDWKNYADYILYILNDSKLLNNISFMNKYIIYPIPRMLTKFEKRGVLLNNNIWELMFYKK